MAQEIWREINDLRLKRTAADEEVVRRLAEEDRIREEQRIEVRREQRGCMDAATKLLLPIFVALESQAPEITAARLHEVTYIEHPVLQPSSSSPLISSIDVTLRWGEKFGYTEEEKAFLREYKGSILRRWQRDVPDILEVLNFSYITAKISPSSVDINPRREADVTTSIGMRRFLDDPKSVYPALEAALSQPHSVRHTIARREFTKVPLS